MIFIFKARQMGHYVMVSLWYESLLTNTRFLFILEWTIVKRIWCWTKKKIFQTTQEGH